MCDVHIDIVYVYAVSSCSVRCSELKYGCVMKFLIDGNYIILLVYGVHNFAMRFLPDFPDFVNRRDSRQFTPL